jgi:hypothetical protein
MTGEAGLPSMMKKQYRYGSGFLGSKGIFSLPYAFGQYFLVILAIDSATDVRVGIEFGGWKCLENWVRREKMVWVTFGCKVGVTGGEVERAYW